MNYLSTFKDDASIPKIIIQFYTFSKLILVGNFIRWFSDST